MATAFGSFGTLFKQGTNTIASIKNITGPGLSVDTIDTTHLASTGNWRTFISGPKDGGEVELDLVWDPTETTHEILEDVLIGGTATAFSTVWSDAGSTTWQFNGLVTGLSPAAPFGDHLTASCTIKITGTPTTV